MGVLWHLVSPMQPLPLLLTWSEGFYPDVRILWKTCEKLLLVIFLWYFGSRTVIWLSLLDYVWFDSHDVVVLSSRISYEIGIERSAWHKKYHFWIQFMISPRILRQGIWWWGTILIPLQDYHCDYFVFHDLNHLYIYVGGK